MQMPESRTVAGLLDEMAARHPELPFVIDGARRYAYPAFRDEARRIARGLAALGIGKGDHVAILMGNRAEWLLVDFAVQMLGAVLVSINTWASRRELAYMLEHSDARLLVTVDRFLKADFPAMLREIGRDSPALAKLRHVICLGGEAADDLLPYERLHDLAETVPDAVIDAAQAAVRPEDVSAILYTSGSTSTPKGVQVQHYALIENMFWIGERMHLQPGERLWLGVSLFWGFACENALFALLSHGGTIVLQEYFEPGEALRLIEAERCSVVYATPNMVRALAEHPARPRHDLSSLRTGATIGTPEQIDLLAEFGAHEICNVYGLTECYGNCAVTDAHLPLSERRRFVGTPLPGVDLVIADPESHAPLPIGEVGEIKVKGYVTCGYYKDADKNAAAFDAEGYFLTGDLGLLDQEGRLFFRGRQKEMVKTGGINVAPIEVEEVLMAHPDVEQAFVVGLPDAERDELLAAVIVPRPGRPVDEAALRAHCREQLAGYKVPRRFRFAAVAELPLTTTGKVQKLRLPELFSGADETSAA
jgi:fatty-acyl-CoA synthase